MFNENQVEIEETVDVVEQENSLDEASAAAATLNVSSSKSQMLSDLMSKVAGMSKQDLSAFLDKTLAQVGKEADSMPDASAKNKASVSNSGAGVPSPRVATTKAMKEDVAEMFAGQDDLSEEFKEQASTIFEAAVNNRVAIVESELQEQYEQKLEESVTESIDELHEQVNQYMDYVVEKWMEENQVAIENNFRVEATETFIDGLKNLFAENYVDVPEEKVDLVDELAEMVASLEESLESVQAENLKLNNIINEAYVEAVFEEISEDMVDTNAEKLRSLAEGIEYANAQEYAEKLKIIKEQYFTESKKENDGSTGLINEEVSVGSNDDVESDDKPVSEEMKHYFQAISSSVRK